jgi:prepilin-type N-terminal cleavage/methylation domain-containing protein
MKREPSMNQQKRHQRGGFTVPEVLIAVAIMVTLLTATAGAMSAVLSSMRVNHHYAQSMQSARMSLQRMLIDLRQGTDHEPTNDDDRVSFRDGYGVDVNSIRLTRPDETEVVFRFNAEDKTIELTDGTDTFVLARRVEAFGFTLLPGRSEESVREGGDFDLLEQAQITMTVKPTDEAPPQTFSAAVTPRSR